MALISILFKGNLLLVLCGGGAAASRAPFGARYLPFEASLRTPRPLGLDGPAHTDDRREGNGNEPTPIRRVDTTHTHRVAGRLRCDGAKVDGCSRHGWTKGGRPPSGATAPP
jgi:hypothetical protein